MSASPSGSDSSQPRDAQGHFMSPSTATTASSADDSGPARKPPISFGWILDTWAEWHSFEDGVYAGFAAGASGSVAVGGAFVLGSAGFKRAFKADQPQIMQEPHYFGVGAVAGFIVGAIFAGRSINVAALHQVFRALGVA